MKDFQKTNPMAVPRPDDLAGWKEADRRLAERIADYLYKSNFLSLMKPVVRYFGTDDLEHFLHAYKDYGVVQAYVNWGLLDYRPTTRSKTNAEKILAEGIPEAEATILRGMMDSHSSLYRVAGHDLKAGTATLDDVLLGGLVGVNDQMLSESVHDGMFLTARVFTVGNFRFFGVSGPPFRPLDGRDAADFLKSSGMEFTRDGLHKDAHMFGWLWGWSDEREANRKLPLLRNTDGDDLLWHTASFSVADQADVRQRLLKRKDIDYCDESDDFIWIKKTGEGAKMLGGPVSMGTIVFVGDELVLTVNSAKRFAAARKWMDKLPGVVFLGVKTRRLDEPDKDRPLDERIAKPEPVEMTPELASAMREMMNKYYMNWLDTPMPALGGKSPREACRVPSGRERVAMLIRTMPDPMGQMPVAVPRQRMLRELGLSDELATPAESEPLMEALTELDDPVHPGAKIGRNDPCPCGSGKKYKKCCGL